MSGIKAMGGRGGNIISIKQTQVDLEKFRQSLECWGEQTRYQSVHRQPNKQGVHVSTVHD